MSVNAPTSSVDRSHMNFRRLKGKRSKKEKGRKKSKRRKSRLWKNEYGQ